MADSHPPAVADPQAPAASEVVEGSPSGLHLVVGGFIALAVIAAVLVGVLAGSAPSRLTPGKPAPGAGEANALFAGVPEQGLSLGSPHAPVTLAELADLQCPQCAGFAQRSLPTLISRYVEGGKLQIVFEPLAIAGSQSLRAAKLAVAAGEQNKLWPFVYLMYRNQAAERSGYVTSDYLRALADSVEGLNASEAFAATRTKAASATIATAAVHAERLGVYSSPSFALYRTGERPRRFVPTSTIDPFAFAAPIERLLAKG